MLLFQNNNLKNTEFCSRGGLQQDFFSSTCVLQNVKSYRFFGGPFFGQILVDVQKHYTNRYFSTCFKSKDWQTNDHFETSLTGPNKRH